MNLEVVVEPVKMWGKNRTYRI